MCIQHGNWTHYQRVLSQLQFVLLDIVDIKPVNMEELTEVITAAEFHPVHCNLFMYSSSKGTIKLSDMRESALCDQHAKCKDTRTLLNALMRPY